MSEPRHRPDHTCVVTVEFQVVPGCMPQFWPRMLAQAATSLGEPGCSQFDVCTDPKDENRVFLYEIYADQAAFDEHLASPHFREFDAATRPWIESKRVAQWHRA